MTTVKLLCADGTSTQILAQKVRAGNRAGSCLGVRSR